MPVQSDSAAAISIDAVQHAPLGPQKVVVRLRGRCREPVPDVDAGVILFVETEGRIHRFPAMGDSHMIRDGAWSFCFEVPAWIAPRLDGQMMLAIGDTIAPVEEGFMSDERRNGGDPDGNGAAGSDELVQALRAQLQERIGALTRVSGVLADAQAELEARAEIHARIESAQLELRGELGHLRELVEQERSRRAEVESRALALAAELDDTHGRLADRIVAADAAEAEVGALRAELERLGRELAAARSGTANRDSGLIEAQALLAEARELTARLRGD